MTDRYTIAVEYLPELDDNPHRLGRHRAHDSRNLQYLAPADATPKSIKWTRHVDPLDQGSLGSCVGNAFTGLLATDPCFPALPAGTTLDEKLAVKIYSRATVDDSYTGEYPPTDTGSDGKSGGQACKDFGLANGYLWAQGLAHLQSAMQTGPVAVGTNWYQGMFDPDTNGFLTIAKNDTVAGGHEYEIVELDMENGRVTMCNSWGTSWGQNGRAYMEFATLDRLLNEGGDVTQLVPLTAPIPTPTPVPPTPGTYTTDKQLKALLDPVVAAFPSWRAHH